MTNALKLERPAKVRPALKLVKTTSLDRDQWLEVRKGGIGSSDAAAAVGLPGDGRSCRRIVWRHGLHHSDS